MRVHQGRGRLRLVQVRTIRERDLTVLHPALAAGYVRVVAAVATRVEAGLSPAVAANRVRCASVDPPVLRLRPFHRERAAFRRRLAGLAADRPCLLLADVRSCFPSIGADAVTCALRALGCPSDPAAEVAAMLRRLARLGACGLPVGPDASAVLANAVLAEVDRAVEASALPYLRWVDDVVVGVADRAEADRVLGSIGSALARVGLELNADKTRVVVGAGSTDLEMSLGVGRLVGT